MDDTVKQFVLKLIQKKARLPKDVDVDTFNYIDSGHVDSIGIIKFLAEIESRFDIEISEPEIESPEFKMVGGVVSIIRNKVASSG